MAPRTRSMVISDDSEPLTMAFAQLDDDLLYLYSWLVEVWSEIV